MPMVMVSWLTVWNSVSAQSTMSAARVSAVLTATTGPRRDRTLEPVYLASVTTAPTRATQTPELASSVSISLSLLLISIVVQSYSELVTIVANW